jgi:filamentous hemagglutinin
VNGYPIFKELFDSADLTLNSAANKVLVKGHAGPHSNFYHAMVLGELTDAVSGFQGVERTVALIKRLEDLARRCATPGNIYNYLITKP